MSERMPVIFVGHGNPMNALYAKFIYEGLGGARRSTATSARDSGCFRALVSARHGGYRDGRAAHHSRFRRFPRRAFCRALRRSG